ncbi:DUF4153 domain-containing protein [Luteimonas sp. MC1825]|uniref:DUF4153 domain-containing protein n=1 Tax=Luteimonas sp. MC1825 TaxID=2761107 RepID=UPI001C882B58|nr:DUF4153 domain-containing protein [Luteimonas sp. MC1825]
MTVDTPLPRNERAFIVLLAVLQGGLMYLAQKGDAAGWWPFNALGGRVCWYTLVLAVPTVMALSVRRLRDARFWQHAVATLLVVAALATWAAWNATGGPGIRASEVLGPFGVSLAIGLFVILPWLQCRLVDGHWRAAYPALVEHAWQNALTLALAALFTAICWAVLYLWAALFALVKITFFRELFREDAFVYLATGAMAGLGVLIGRTQARAVQVARQVLFAIFTGLLPLLAFIAVLFVVSLPFTGLAPLWERASAATILVSVVALLVVFTNAVFQDGEGTPPYPAWLRRVVDAGLLVLPLYAVLALYALWLRIAQHGWTSARVWAVLLVAVVAAHAFGYAFAALRGRGHWLGPVRGVNRVMSWVVVALVVLANSPVIDGQRIGVASQMQRLADGRTAPDDFDLAWLRFDSGRRGYLATLSLRGNPAFTTEPARLAELERVLARPSRWGGFEPGDDNRKRDAEALRADLQLAGSAVAPDDGWWQALAAGRLGAGDCLREGSDCILLTPDLDGDGTRETLLCVMREDMGGDCTHATPGADGAWRVTGSLGLWQQADGGRAGRRQLRADLLAGRIAPQPRRWPDVRIGDGPVREFHDNRGEATVEADARPGACTDCGP